MDSLQKPKPCLEELELKVRKYKLAARRSEAHYRGYIADQESRMDALMADNARLRAMLEKPVINFN